MAEYTMKQLVENHPKAFRPELAEGVDAVIQYVLTGEEGGNYIITIKDGVCTTAEGLAENPNMTLTAEAQDFKDVLLGKANGMQNFMMGKLKLSVDLNLAMKLTSFFKKG
jgi:putative sterol carrier protein